MKIKHNNAMRVAEREKKRIPVTNRICQWRSEASSAEDFEALGEKQGKAKRAVEINHSESKEDSTERKVKHLIRASPRSDKLKCNVNSRR
jgi:hypothetical protein